MKSEFAKHVDVTKQVHSENWTEKSNCYAYALRRPDIGWVNPGCLAKVFGTNENVSLSEIFAAYSSPQREEKTAEQHYTELLEKDGCTLLAGGTQEALSHKNVMFVALINSGGRCDYHCYRYEGEGFWTSKPSTEPPEVHGFHTEDSLMASVRILGGIPLGFFELPDLPQTITPEQSKALKETMKALNKCYKKEHSWLFSMFSR